MHDFLEEAEKPLRVRRTGTGVLAFLSVALFLPLFCFALTPRLWGLPRKTADYALYAYGGGRVTVTAPNALSALGTHGGEALCFTDGSLSAEEILEYYGAALLKIEEVDGIAVYYGYTPRLLGGERLPFGTVNLQIAQTEGRLTVGTPLLYSSY